MPVDLLLDRPLADVHDHQALAQCQVFGLARREALRRVVRRAIQQRRRLEPAPVLE